MVESTHDVVLGDTEVVKRYRSWDRGEAEREWQALTLLHHHCPGLAPEPFAFRRENGTPVIVMARVPGTPLGSSPLTPEQVVAVAKAMQKLHRALPEAGLVNVEERRSGPREMVEDLRSWSRSAHAPVGPLVTSAEEAAIAWLDGLSASDLVGASTERVFTLADGNLGNFLWDGDRCRLVDFEDSGLSQVPYEVADLVEHVSVWLPGLIDADLLVDTLGLSSDQRLRLANCRTLFRVYWLLMLLPGNRGHERNPAGSVERQAQRLLDMLDASLGAINPLPGDREASL